MKHFAKSAVAVIIALALPASASAAPRLDLDVNLTFEPAVFVNAESSVHNNCTRRTKTTNRIWFEIKREGQGWTRFEPGGAVRGQPRIQRQGTTRVSRQRIRAPAPQPKDKNGNYERVKLRIVAVGTVICGKQRFYVRKTRRLWELEPSLEGSVVNEDGSSIKTP